MLLPTLDAEQMQHLVDEFAKARSRTFNGVLLDNSGAHRAKRLKLPPAASPELNPAERVWQDLKEQLA